MADPVNPRRYNNARRAANAQRTRKDIVASAHRLFLHNGYPSTTLAAIAEHAEVSVQSVYATFGSKRAVLKAVLDEAVAGDDQPVPISQREWVQHILDEPNPETKVALNSRGVADIMQRVSALEGMLRSAAQIDPEADDLWRASSRQRAAGMTQFADHLHDAGHLPEGLPPAHAAERLTVLTDPELYRLTVLERQWTHEQYETWLTDLTIASVLRKDRKQTGHTDEPR